MSIELFFAVVNLVVFGGLLIVVDNKEHKTAAKLSDALDRERDARKQLEEVTERARALRNSLNVTEQEYHRVEAMHRNETLEVHNLRERCDLLQDECREKEDRLEEKQEDYDNLLKKTNAMAVENLGFEDKLNSAAVLADALMVDNGNLIAERERLKEEIRAAEKDRQATIAECANLTGEVDRLRAVAAEQKEQLDQWQPKGFGRDTFLRDMFNVLNYQGDGKGQLNADE